MGISRLVPMCSRTNGLSVWHTWIKASQEGTRLFLKSLQAPEMCWDPSLYMVCPRQRVHQAVSEGGCSLLWCTGDLKSLWQPGLSGWCIQPMLMIRIKAKLRALQGVSLSQPPQLPNASTQPCSTSPPGPQNQFPLLSHPGSPAGFLVRRGETHSPRL